MFLRVTPGDQGDHATVDRYALAARLAADAVLGYHTALELHGVAQSGFQRLFVVTWTRVRPLRFQSYELVPVRPRAGLKRESGAFVVVLERGGDALRVTSLERTVVDVLDRPELAGGVEEVLRSLAAVVALDFHELERYLQLVQRPVLAARLGFCLERERERWLVPDGLLASLERARPRGPVCMDRRVRGALVPRWNLVVPLGLPSKKGEPGDVDA